jgi:hypothetical protein
VTLPLAALPQALITVAPSRASRMAAGIRTDARVGFGFTHPPGPTRDTTGPWGSVTVSPGAGPSSEW